MWGSCGQARTRGRSRSSRGTADKEQARDDLIGGVEISMRQYLFFEIGPQQEHSVYFGVLGQWPLTALSDRLEGSSRHR